ncbi:MAG: DUF3299 domain-containing protein [Pirellulaceae bacterium]
MSAPKARATISTFAISSVRLVAVGLLLLHWLSIGSVVAQVPSDTLAEQPDKNPRQRPVTARAPVEERLSRETAKAKGDLTFDDIKFDIEKGGKFSRSLLTQDIEELDKKTVRIRGYILPASVFKQSGIEEFVLVRDNMECCFGPGAALFDCIIVQMEPGKTADFTTRPVAVRGKFEIKEFMYPDSDEHYAIYRMVATEVK